MYADALEEGGDRVVQAADGAAGVRIATTAKLPDLVMMHLSIPLVTGADAIGLLKAATDRIGPA